MKILLIAPYVNIKFDHGAEDLSREDFYPSAALMHLAAILRSNNYEPIILDLNNAAVHNQIKNYLDYSKKVIIDSLNKFKPDLVGINCLFSGTFPDVLRFAEIVKSHSPNLKIATGGIHPTSFPKEILTNCNNIDYVALGEGENTIVALAALIKAKNEKLLSSIKSFAYRDKEGIIRINREKNYIDDLNSLPMPAWDLININKFKMNLDHYYNPSKLPVKYKAAIFSSRACPLACNFCDMYLVMGKKHRKRNVKTIVDEIEVLNQRYGVNYFSFMDDQLTLNKAHIIDLCNEILKRKLKIVFDTPNGLWINSLMGVGTPSDILGAVKRGIDMFDCVLPTRLGRTGVAFTWNGRINIKNSKFKNDNSPLDEEVTLCDLNKYSKNYLNHLFNTNEILGSMLLTMHNINFYQQLMNQIRETIAKGTFDVFYDKYINII